VRRIFFRALLKLLLVRALNELADAARGRAHAVHEGLVLLALLLLGPRRARVLMVSAECRAEPTRVRALLHHGKRVVDALAGFGPDFALRHVLVGAHNTVTHATTSGAFLEHESRVLEALTVCSPPRAITLHICAGGLARLARNRAGANHELRVLVALARCTPAFAVLIQVLALRCAQTAAGRAETKHGVRVCLTLALLRPAAASGIGVVARMRADSARERAN